VGTREVSFKPEEIIHFKFTPVSSSAYGLSMIAPVYDTINQLNQLDKNMLKIVKRYASPKIIWKFASGASNEEMNAFADFLDTLPVDRDPIITDNVTSEVITIDPRGRFENYLAMLNEKVQTGLKTPLLSYLRNATEASATVMLEYYKERIEMIRRYMKRTVEREVFEPLVRDAGLSETPRLNWGRIEEPELVVADLLKAYELGGVRTDELRKNLVKMGWTLWEEEESPAAASED
jgi:hypothetical protein